MSRTATLAVQVKGAAHRGGRDLTTGTVTVAPTDEAPTWATPADRYFQQGMLIVPFRFPPDPNRDWRGPGAFGGPLAGCIVAPSRSEAA